MKILRGERELSEKDVEEISKGLIPGEWVCVVDMLAKKKYISYINPHADLFFKIKIVAPVDWSFDSSIEENKIAEKVIAEFLLNSIKKRSLFINYDLGSRLVYGASDSLPGLIVDKYQRYILIQINTAGIDRFRNLILSQLQESFKTHKVIFYDNEEYRKTENLPQFEKFEMSEDLEVVENGLQYKIPVNVLQKIGYYYDHRENRARIKNLLLRMDIKKNKGLDLFSYVGSWGMHLLAAGVGCVEFVDQGQMQEVIKTNLEINNFADRGIFLRADVFKYLDQALVENKKFDVIVSDPPAFTKSEKNKNSAILGYEKLHTKAMKLLSDQGVMIAASCTHYVNYEELDRTVQEAAYRNGQKIQLLDIGGQGLDHPMTGLKDRSFYIKYLAYYVSRG